MSTYYESAEDITITRRRAIQELNIHGATPDLITEFFAEMGTRDEYGAQEVLSWLGY